MEYKIEYTFSSLEDMKRMKKYIVETFQYKELGENFSKKMKEATDGLKVFPNGFDTVGFQYRGYSIRMRPYDTYMLFYIVEDADWKVTVLRVLQNRMNWKRVLRHWLMQHKKEY